MEDWEKLFYNAELSHIGEQIVNYLGVDDLWSLRQVNKKLKNIAEDQMIKLFNRIEEHWQNFPTLSWHGNTAFWKRRGACNFIKFHHFFKKTISDPNGFSIPVSIVNLFDPEGEG